MANIKISELTALTPPAAADELPVVDVSATSTKKTTVGEVVGIINGDVEVANDGTATISELPVSKLQDGTARQLLQTDAAGTGVEWTSNIDVPGTLDVTGAATLDSTLTVPLGSAAAPTLRFTGDTNTGLYSPGADQVAISTNGSQRLLIDSTGQIEAFYSATAQAGPFVILSKSRGTQASPTIVTNNDYLGIIGFSGYDGTDYATRGAEIAAMVDGTPGADDLPTRLVFSTTADGASSPTTRMMIVSNGDTLLHNLSSFYPNTDNAVNLGLDIRRWTAVYAVNGTIQTSDKREKIEVKDSSLGVNFIKSLRPVSYKWIEGGKRDTGERDEDNNYIYESVPGQRIHWGFIAQEVKEAVDAAGVDFGGWVLTDKDDPDSQQALRYDQFIAPLTKALQEALAEIDVLKAKVAVLEAQ